MPLLSYLFSERKIKTRDKLSNEARDRSASGRITSSAYTAMSSSSGSRWRKENKVKLLAERKRKADVLDEESKASSSQLPAARSSGDRRRKHKSPRTSLAVKESYPNRATRTSVATAISASANSNAKKDSSHVVEAVRATNMTVPRSLMEETSETETLRKKVSIICQEAERSRQTLIQQAQTIEELKRSLAATKKVSRRQSSEIDKLKSSGKKSEELLAALQGNLQCQICLEMLYQPYTLHPCGHVACQSCLQTWFKTVPKQVEEDLDDVPPIFRVKRCPCCRAVILSRPTPLFLIRDLVETVVPNSQAASTLTFDSNPWRGIFPLETREPDFDDDATDVDYESDPDYDPLQPPAFLFDSDEEDEPEYSLPDYAPPYYISRVSRRDFRNMSAEHFELLQRGATLGMIRRYEMRLHREQGIAAWSQHGAQLYFGWNISFDEDEDPDGRQFMEWVHRQIADYPERWSLDESADHPVYRRLVHEGDQWQVLGQEYDDHESDDDW